MLLNKIEDPRDTLQRARRPELVAFAQANGQKDINEQMPADEIRKILRERGLTRIQIRNIPIGHIGRHEVRPLHQAKPQSPAPAGPQLSADELAQFREWQKQQQASAGEPADIDRMDMKALRKACKAQGIPMARTDNMNTLRDKLKAAPHG